MRQPRRFGNKAEKDSGQPGPSPARRRRKCPGCQRVGRYLSLVCNHLGCFLSPCLRMYSHRSSTDDALVAMLLLGHSTKPQVAKAVLSSPGIQEALKDKLLVSICAGVTIEQLQSWTTPTTTVIRAMPNTPCKVYSDSYTRHPKIRYLPSLIALICLTIVLDSRRHDSALVWTKH